MRDPSNIFKDAVDRLFQDAMAALNSWNDIPWHCLYSIGHPILSWKLPTCAQAQCLSPIDDESFKYLQRCFWQAVLGCRDGSEWFKWHTLRFLCLNMTFHSQVTIANSHERCLPPMDKVSFICLQRCSWRALLGHHGGFEWFKWRFLAWIWHPVLTWQLPTGTHAVNLDRWLILHMYS